MNNNVKIILINIINMCVCNNINVCVCNIQCVMTILIISNVCVWK